MKNTINNFIYQSIFQITKIVLPIITIPLVSDALGPHGIGMYNYTNSIAQYFVLFAGLGIGVYGNREIAVNRDNKITLSRTFWELFTMSFYISMVSVIIYFIVVTFSANRAYFYLQSLIIIAAVFDISWFFMGIEDFKKTSLSSLFSQVISFFLIVFFIKDGDDLGKYILIQGLNLFFSQVIMWIYIRKKIIFIKVTLSDTLKHFMPALSFFIPKIAIVLYTNLNKTLLGWLDSAESVGYYANTMTINSILVTLITTMDLVLLPKLSNLVAHGNAKNVLKVIKQTLGLQLYFTIPIMFGVWSITPKFVSWFFGDKFLFIEKTIPIVAPLIIVIPIGMAVGRQYLVPYNKMKVYNFAVIMGAFISIVTNVVLIPIYGIYGALIATIASEFFVTITRFRAFKKETQFEIDYRGIILNVLSGAIMFVMIRMLTNNLGSSLVTTIIQVTLGIGVYLCLTTILQTNPLIGLIKKYIN